MKSKLAFVRQPDSIPRKTAFSLRCFAAILLRLPPETEAHSTPLQGGADHKENGNEKSHTGALRRK